MTATNPTAPTTFTVGCMEFTVHGTLTLGQKQLLRGRSLTQHDPETGWHFCVDCLSDLPHDRVLWFDHVCTDEPVCLDGTGPTAEPEPASGPVTHKTRTAEIGTATPTGGLDWYGSPIVIYGHVSKAFCTCGWKSGWCDTRVQARAEARYHREHPRADAA